MDDRIKNLSSIFLCSKCESSKEKDHRVSYRQENLKMLNSKGEI